MTLLSPIPAIIAGALAIPALLFLYFLKLRRRPVRVSSTLLWSHAVQDLQVNVPFRWLRASWLLLLQLAILALLLLALARPAIDMQGPAAARAIILLDESASMSARLGAGTRLDAAKERATRLIDDLTRAGTAVCLVALAADARVSVPFTTNRGALRDAVAGATGTDQPGDLGAALRLAGALLAGETDEQARVRPGLVILISDGSFATADGLTLAGGEFRFDSVAPADPGQRGIDNLGIVALAARRDYDDPGLVRVFVRIRNAGPTATAVPIVFSFGDRVIERRVVTVPGAATPDGAAEAGPAEAGPAEAAASFQADAREAGVIVVRIDRRDQLDADNGAAAVLAAPTKPRVVVVVPDAPEAAPRGGPEWLLTDVLQEIGMRSLRVVPSSAFARSGPPADTDLVIFDRVRPDALPALPTMSFGAGLPIAGLSVAAPTGEPAGTYFLSWHRTHPIMRSVALDTVFVGRPLALSVPEDPVTDRYVELARGADGPLIELIEQGRTRRLIVAFELAHSNWPLNFGFPIFLAAAVDHLTLRGDDRAGGYFTTTEPVELEASPESSRVVLRGPVDVAADVRAGVARAALGTVPRAGVYDVDGSPAARIAVNMLDPTETAGAWGDTLRVGGETVAASGSGRGPRELWPWLLLGALVLLAAEWLLNAWTMRV